MSAETTAINFTKAEKLYMQQGIATMIMDVIKQKEAVAAQMVHSDNSSEYLLNYFCRRHKELMELQKNYSSIGCL